jgi:hypothetical protein
VELERGPAVELERGPAVELELVQVEAVLAPDHPRVQLAVALRTKSVTAARRPGLPLRAEEDLAAVAEITREPAAIEAAAAWVAADTAVAVAGIAVVVV